MTDHNQLATQFRYSWRLFLGRGIFAGGVRVTGLVFVFGLQVLLARLIGDTAEYGKYAWGQSLLFMVGTMACAGIPVVTSRFIASLASRQQEQAIAPVIKKALVLLARISLVPLFGVGLLWLVWPSTGDNTIYRNTALLALLLSPAWTLASFLQDISRARQWFGLAMLPIQVLRPATTAMLALGCWAIAPSSLQGNLAVGFVGASLLLISLPQAAIYRSRHRRQADKSSHVPVAPEYSPSRLFPTALPIFFTQIAGASITYSNVLLVGVLAGPTAAGAYFAAERLAKLASIPKTITSLINQPSIAAASAAEDHRQLQLFANQSAHGMLWPTLFIAICILFFSEDMLSVFGQNFIDASSVLLILVAAGIIASLAGPAKDILIMSGQQQLIPRVMAISAVIHIAVLAILVPRFGVEGAAWTTLVSTSLSQFWLAVLTVRHTAIISTVWSPKRWRAHEQ